MRVSIIIAYFNSRTTIQTALRSCLNQDYQDLEILLVDNNSSDGSSELLKNSFSDNRIKFLFCEKQGVSYARNIGIEAASGDFICFLDSDDELHPSSVSSRVSYMNAFSLDAVGSNYLMKNRRREKVVTVQGSVTAARFKWGNPIANLTGMYRVSVIGKVYQKAIHHEDYQMWWEIFDRAGRNCGYLNEVTATYNVSSDGLSSSLLKNMIGHYGIVRNKTGAPIPRLMIYMVSYSLKSFGKRYLP